MGRARIAEAHTRCFVYMELPEGLPTVEVAVLRCVALYCTKRTAPEPDVALGCGAFADHIAGMGCRVGRC